MPIDVDRCHPPFIQITSGGISVSEPKEALFVFTGLDGQLIAFNLELIKMGVIDVTCTVEGFVLLDCETHEVIRECELAKPLNVIAGQEVFFHPGTITISVDEDLFTFTPSSLTSASN